MRRWDVCNKYNKGIPNVLKLCESRAVRTACHQAKGKPQKKGCVLRQEVRPKSHRGLLGAEK